MEEAEAVGVLYVRLDLFGAFRFICEFDICVLYLKLTTWHQARIHAHIHVLRYLVISSSYFFSKDSITCTALALSTRVLVLVLWLYIICLFLVHLVHKCVYVLVITGSDRRTIIYYILLHILLSGVRFQCNIKPCPRHDLDRIKRSALQAREMPGGRTRVGHRRFEIWILAIG
jgi:hypothetical protein